jgi:hypothetical protein
MTESEVIDSARKFLQSQGSHVLSSTPVRAVYVPGDSAESIQGCDIWLVGFCIAPNCEPDSVAVEVKCSDGSMRIATLM